MVPSVYLTRPDEQLVSVVTHFFRQVNGADLLCSSRANLNIQNFYNKRERHRKYKHTP